MFIKNHYFGNCLDWLLMTHVPQAIYRSCASNQVYTFSQTNLMCTKLVRESDRRGEAGQLYTMVTNHKNHTKLYKPGIAGECGFQFQISIPTRHQVKSIKTFIKQARSAHHATMLSNTQGIHKTKLNSNFILSLLYLDNCLSLSLLSHKI